MGIDDRRLLWPPGKWIATDWARGRFGRDESTALRALQKSVYPETTVRTGTRFVADCRVAPWT